MADFDEAFTRIFDVEFSRLFRYLDRLGGDPDLASDLAQEAFVRLYRRGSLPDSPGPWLATVAMNLFRNHRSTSSRRARMLTPQRADASHADASPDASSMIESAESRRRVRDALDRLPERDRQLLLLRAEGFSYQELAGMLALPVNSVGTLLSRARAALKTEVTHAP